MGNQTPQTFAPATGGPTGSDVSNGRQFTHAGAIDALHQSIGAGVTHAAIHHRDAVPHPHGRIPGSKTPAHKPTHSATHKRVAPHIRGKVAVKPSAKPAPRGKPKAKPTSKAPRPAAKPAPKPKGVAHPTNSPAPVAVNVQTGGLFDGIDLFPILLLAGGALALWWLYTHRKRG